MIELRSLKCSDIDAIAKYANNFNVSQYLSSRMPYPYTREHAQWWVETGSKYNGTHFAIDLKGECIGSVGVRYGEHETQYSGEIGYWIAEHHWGKGFASAATSKMTDYVFAETEIVRIAALVYSPNTASMKVLEKCGCRLEAIRQKAGFKHGVFLDEHAFVKFRP